LGPDILDTFFTISGIFFYTIFLVGLFTHRNRFLTIDLSDDRLVHPGTFHPESINPVVHPIPLLSGVRLLLNVVATGVGSENLRKIIVGA
jgi:hypothetical protein